MRRLVLAVALVVPAPAPATGIDTIAGLKCRSDGVDFMVVFYPDQKQASVTIGTQFQYYRYEPKGAFLTWQLVDGLGRQRYTLRQGDVINGDFGWYFSIPTVDGSAKPINGQCKVLESPIPQ